MKRISELQKKPLFKTFPFKTILAVLATGMLAYLLAKTDLKLLWAHLRQLPLPIMLLLIALQLLTQLALNYQWYRLCKSLNMKTSFFRLLVANSYGVIADAITPGEKVGGEVVRVVQLKRMLGYGTDQSASLTAIQKSISIFALVLLNIAALAALSGRIGFLQAAAAKTVLILILAALALFLLSMVFYTDKINSFMQRLPFNGKTARGIKKWMMGFASDTKQISSQPKRWIFQLLLSFGIWALFPMKLFILVSQYTVVNIFVLYAVTFISYFAAMIPILPGGLGTFEGTMSGLLLVYGLTPEEAVAVSLVFRFVTFWFVVLLSAAVILLWKLLSYIRKKEYGFE